MNFFYYLIVNFNIICDSKNKILIATLTQNYRNILLKNKKCCKTNIIKVEQSNKDSSH